MSQTLVRDEVVSNVVAKLQENGEVVTKKLITEVYNHIFDEIQDALVEGRKVSNVQIGNLVTVERAARKGRNPQTGEEIQIAASVTAKLKPSKQLKDRLNG